MAWRLLTAAAGVGALVMTSDAQLAVRSPRSSVADAGLSVAVVDAGVRKAQAPAPSLENERLRAELEQLRQRTAALEQEADEARRQNLALGDVADRLAAIRASLDAQQQTTRASAQRAADARRAVANILYSEQQLSTGDTNVGTIVDANQLSLLPPRAQSEIAAALNALANEDLQIARSYLMQAAADAQLVR